MITVHRGVRNEWYLFSKLKIIATPNLRKFKLYIGRLFLVNCYLLHVPRLPSQPASSSRGWVIEKNWLEMAWQYIAMAKYYLNIINHVNQTNTMLPNLAQNSAENVDLKNYSILLGSSIKYIVSKSVIFDPSFFWLCVKVCAFNLKSQNC